VIGIVIYFLYGFRRSGLHRVDPPTPIFREAEPPDRP
jgi:hypothetical protein